MAIFGDMSILLFSVVLHQNQTRITFRNKQNVRQTSNAHISEARQVANFTSDRYGFVIL